MNNTYFKCFEQFYQKENHNFYFDLDGFKIYWYRNFPDSSYNITCFSIQDFLGEYIISANGMFQEAQQCFQEKYPNIMKLLNYL